MPKGKRTSKKAAEKTKDTAIADLADHGLTLKQEKFVHAYLETGNASEAYRRAYDVQNMTSKSVNEQASRLLANRKVAARVAAWRERAIDQTVLSKTWVLEKLMRNARIALGEETIKVKVRGAEGTEEYEVTQRDASAANRALELLGKEQGMFIDRKEVGKPNQFKEMSDEELRDFIAAETKALGFEVTMLPMPATRTGSAPSIEDEPEPDVPGAGGGSLR